MAAQNDEIFDTPSDIQLPFVQKPQIAGAQPAIIASIVVLGITPIGALPTDPIAGNKGLRCCFWMIFGGWLRRLRSPPNHCQVSRLVLFAVLKRISELLVH